MEFIVQLFRALANRVRIRILRLLAALGEANVSAIAEATGCEISLVSAHLRVLAAAGLVWRRRSASVVWYRVAEHAHNPVTAAALTTLMELFAAITIRDPKAVSRLEQADRPTRSDAALFACFTSFTHPRRLQIIRYLAQEGAVGAGEVASRLSMSARAAARHLDKLDRRGYVRRKSRGPLTTYRLATGKGAVQQAVFRAVVSWLIRAAQ